ncbi:MAG: site-specific integrase [Treponema sp.]|nr:site-specific integrase [Candidatus Treponema caballi]
MDYHVFTKKIKNKKKPQFYYWFYDPITHKQIQKRCTDCVTRYDAEAFVRSLPALTNKSTKIKDIAKYMYIPGSLHVERRKSLGRSANLDTLYSARTHLNYLINTFGDEDIRTITVEKIFNKLVKDRHSSSWKNQVLGCLKELYEEASWNGIAVSMPIYPKFKYRQTKSDVFTPEELERLLSPHNFPDESSYMLFLLTASAGLRISEARGFRACQFLEDRQMIIVDGFMNRKNTQRNNYNKKGSADNPKWRVSIITQRCTKELADYISRAGRGDTDILFTYNGVSYRIEYLRTLFNRALKKAKIEKGDRKLTMHSLRYTYVTEMRTILDVDTVRKMVGHTTVEMTEYYTRSSLDTASSALLPFVSAVNQKLITEKE